MHVVCLMILCRGWMELIRGKIWSKSAPGSCFPCAGTTFLVITPSFPLLLRFTFHDSITSHLLESFHVLVCVYKYLLNHTHVLHSFRNQSKSLSCQQAQAHTPPAFLLLQLLLPAALLSCFNRSWRRWPQRLRSMSWRWTTASRTGSSSRGSSRPLPSKVRNHKTSPSPITMVSLL